MKDVRNERNQIVDAGLDLNDPGAFGEWVLNLQALFQILNLKAFRFGRIN
jgi:hypothetical protein